MYNFFLELFDTIAPTFTYSLDNQNYSMNEIETRLNEKKYRPWNHGEKEKFKLKGGRKKVSLPTIQKVAMVVF